MKSVVSHVCRVAVAAGLAVTAAACAQQTAYAPANGRTGYAEQKIENNRYRVSFSGNSLTERETVETYLLYRAAELTVNSGYDYFIVVQQDTERSTTYRSTFYDYPYPHHFFYSWYGYPHHHFGGDIAFGDTRPVERYRAVAEIVMYAGAKPPDDPSAFDAREVMKHLGPAIRRPE